MTLMQWQVIGVVKALTVINLGHTNMLNQVRVQEIDVVLSLTLTVNKVAQVIMQRVQLYHSHP